MKGKPTISTHVLDTSLGVPAANITVSLDRIEHHAVTRISSYVTDDDGRIAALVPGDEPLAGGHYRLCFDVATYFGATRRKSFYSVICVNFQVDDTPQHYHVPLLLSPFGYSTYRGS